MDFENHPMSDAEMLKQIWDEIRYVRKRLDDHVDDENTSIEVLQADMTKIREEMSGHRVKIGLMLGGIGVAVSSALGWMVNHISKLTA